jgi:hypothetical protein
MFDTIEAQMVMNKLHEGRHFATKITQMKTLDVGYWWPTIYRDVRHYYKSCDACQRIGGLATQSLAKLVTSFPKDPFTKWGLDFVGPIKPIKRLQETNIFL